jgi:hypothetical protein
VTAWAAHKRHVEWPGLYADLISPRRVLCLEAVLQRRDSKIDQLQSSRWRAYHNGLATVRAQFIATTYTAIRSLAIDGTEDRDLQQHITHLPDNLQPHTSLRSSAHHNDHSPRPPTCFLRRYLLGDRRRNTALLITLGRTLCCLFFCFCFSLLVWSLLPISFFFWISKCSHLLLSPCCLGFYTREEVDHGEYVDVTFAQELSVGGC